MTPENGQCSQLVTKPGTGPVSPPMTAKCGGVCHGSVLAHTCRPSRVSPSQLGTEEPRDLVLKPTEPGDGKNLGEHELEINVHCV